MGVPQPSCTGLLQTSSDAGVHHTEVYFRPPVMGVPQLSYRVYFRPPVMWEYIIQSLLQTSSDVGVHHTEVCFRHPVMGVPQLSYTS